MARGLPAALPERIVRWVVIVMTLVGLSSADAGHTSPNATAASPFGGALGAGLGAGACAIVVLVMLAYARRQRIKTEDGARGRAPAPGCGSLVGSLAMVSVAAALLIGSSPRLAEVLAGGAWLGSQHGPRPASPASPAQLPLQPRASMPPELEDPAAEGSMPREAPLAGGGAAARAGIGNESAEQRGRGVRRDLSHVVHQYARESAAPLEGPVGVTVVAGTDARTRTTYGIGSRIHGPMEAGFGALQYAAIGALGCAPAELGYVVGGIDTRTAEQLVAKQCAVALPRIEGGRYLSLVDECGAHTGAAHLHERLACLYDGGAAGHSPRIGVATDAARTPIYGRWESSDVLPQLDACGAHFGPTAESEGVDVYHHHVQETAPFTVGCYGPTASGVE